MAKKFRKGLRKARLIYYNMGDGSDLSKAEDLEEAYDLGFDVMALSEHADRADVTDTFLKAHHEYARYYDPEQVGGAKECLIYRKDLGTLTLGKTTVLVKARKLPPGAGPENASPKVAHRIRLRINNHRATFIVAHQYATVGSRREAASLFIRALKDLVRSIRGVVVFFGDLNATPGHALVRALRGLFTGSSAPKSGATHKNRLIDYIMVRGGKILGAHTRKLSSDHKMLIVDALI